MTNTEKLRRKNLKQCGREWNRGYNLGFQFMYSLVTENVLDRNVKDVAEDLREYQTILNVESTTFRFGFDDGKADAILEAAGCDVVAKNPYR